MYIKAGHMPKTYCWFSSPFLNLSRDGPASYQLKDMLVKNLAHLAKAASNEDLVMLSLHSGTASTPSAFYLGSGISIEEIRKGMM